LLGACIEADNRQLSGLVPKTASAGGVPNPALTEVVNPSVLGVFRRVKGLPGSGPSRSN
jgi:hypothetical protein